jgi:WD40 repeat protein
LALVDGFHGGITSIAWNPTPEGIYLTTGSSDNSVRVWQLIEEGDHCYMRLHWSSIHGVLVLSRATIQNVQGLSRINIQLLKQRGAVGEPDPPLDLLGAKSGWLPPYHN